MYVLYFSYLCIMKDNKFKTFSPIVDTKRRLVMSRFYTGVNSHIIMDGEVVPKRINGANSFCYVIHHITKKGSIDKRYKYLYSFGTDDYSKVKEFYNANTGEPTRIFKSSFKGVFKLKSKFSIISIWLHSQLS